jgi:OFA family oxalate/formate antiporter-like MFS transporter
MKKTSKIFYGWWIVTSGTIIIIVGGGIGWKTFGVFFMPLIDQFHWSRGDLSLAMSLFSIVWVVGPFAGKFIDRQGVRRIMAAGALVAGISFALLSLTHSIWYIYLMYLANGIGFLGIVDIPIVAAVSNWFEKKRGLAMSIVMSGYGMGGLIFMPLTSLLIDRYGWSTTYLILGLLMILVQIPLTVLVFRHKPSDLNMSAYGQSAGNDKKPADEKVAESFSLKEAMQNSNFWLLVISMSLSILVLSSVMTHAVPFLQGYGFTNQSASNILAFASGMSIPGALLTGYLSDKISTKRLMSIVMLFQAAGVAFLLVGHSSINIILFIILFGAGIESLFILMPLAIQEFFGLKSIGAIYGGVWEFVAVSMAFGPTLTGYLFDVTRSYQLAFLLCLGLIGISITIISLMKKTEKVAKPYEN